MDIMECTDLTKKYGKFEAVSNISCKIGAGRIVGLLGPNGSGKTTLLKLAAGLLNPTSGEIKISGSKTGINTKKLVSFLPEHIFLNGNIKINEIIDIYNDFFMDFDRNKAYDILHKLDIGCKDKLKAMSSGAVEKIQLALIISRNVSLYLLDEPLKSIDSSSREYIIKNYIINNYVKSTKEATVIISTQMISSIENMLDHVIVMNSGKIVLDAETEQLKKVWPSGIDNLLKEAFKCY